jgi:glycosyltransferase involved in cell wall biosynthesis
VADLPTLPLAIKYKKIFGCPLILDCHEWWKEQYLIWGDGRPDQAKIYDRYEKELYKEADLLLTVGQKLAEDMSVYFQNTFHCIYTCDSIGLDQSTDKSNFWIKYIPNYAGQKICIFQGSMTPQRDLDLLAKLTATLEDGIKLVVVGAGSYVNEFMRIVADEGDPEKVVYLGWRTQKELVELTNNADLGVIPYTAKSRYFSTGAPNKLFEFLNAKLPIVFDKSMIEIDLIVSGNNLGQALEFKNFSSVGAQISRILKNNSEIDQYKKAYEKLGDKYLFEGQKRNFISLAYEFLK